MPNKKSAIKYIKSSDKRKKRNRIFKEKIKKSIKDVKKALEEKNESSIEELSKKAQKVIDKASQKKVIKKRTADRMKSKLLKKAKK